MQHLKRNVFGLLMALALIAGCDVSRISRRAHRRLICCVVSDG